MVVRSIAHVPPALRAVTPQRGVPTIASVFRAGSEPFQIASIATLQSQDEETAAYRRNRIWRFIADRGGATCWAVEQAFGALHQTVSAAISNLSAHGLLVDTGERRPTGSGRKAIVWGAVQ